MTEQHDPISETTDERIARLLGEVEQAKRDVEATVDPDQASEPAEAPLPCAICASRIESVWPEDNPSQPYDAQQFVSFGDYGSTCFDPGDGSYLRLNICRRCLHHLAECGRAEVVTVSGDGDHVGAGWDGRDHEHRTSDDASCGTVQISAPAGHV